MALPRPGDACVDELGDFDFMVKTASELDLPDGLGSEVFGENIIVSPWLPGNCARPLYAIVRQLEARVRPEFVVSAMPFRFRLREAEAALGPDAYVFDPDRIDPDSVTAPSEALILAAELTSPATRCHDVGEKLDAYGKSGVPVYLLVDMQESELVVFSVPSDRGYRARAGVDFGKSAYVPEPFDFELDTSAFRRDV